MRLDKIREICRINCRIAKSVIITCCTPVVSRPFRFLHSANSALDMVLTDILCCMVHGFLNIFKKSNPVSFIGFAVVSFLGEWRLLNVEQKLAGFLVVRWKPVL